MRKCGHVTVALTIHALIGPQMGSDITSVTDTHTHTDTRYLDDILIIVLAELPVLRTDLKVFLRL